MIVVWEYILISIGTNGFRSNVMTSDKKSKLVKYLKRKGFKWKPSWKVYSNKEDYKTEYVIERIQKLKSI